MSEQHFWMAFGDQGNEDPEPIGLFTNAEDAERAIEKVSSQFYTTRLWHFIPESYDEWLKETYPFRFVEPYEEPEAALPQAEREEYPFQLGDAEGGTDEEVIEEAESRGIKPFPESYGDSHAYAEQCREFLAERDLRMSVEDMEPDVGPEGDS